MVSDSADPSTPPPATHSVMTPEKRKQLQQCFSRAKELANRDKPDFDYAHDLYSQCVVNDPSNLVYVEALLGNLQTKYKNNKKGSRLRGFGGRKAFNNAVEEEDWDEVFREAMDLLKTNPWDVAVLRAVALACAHSGFNEVELRYLKNALDAKPKDVEVNRHCAQSLARMGQFDMAIACWNRVAEKTKGEEAQKMMSELTMAKTMGAPVSAEAVGNIGPRPTRANPVGEEETPAEVSEDAAEPAPEEKREIRLNPRQKLEKAIKETPSAAANYFALAELHTDERRYQDAEKVLQNAIQAVGSSLKLQTALEDARIRSAKARVAIAEKRVASSKTSESQELVTKLRGEQNRLELDVYQQRCQRYPENHRLRYDLGLRLRRAQNYQQAIKSYEQACADPQCLVAATLEMGECWQQLKQYSKAMKCYEDAIENSNAADEERRKLALYRGGVLAAAMKNAESAKQWFTELVKIDADFKDAADRLDKLA